MQTSVVCFSLSQFLRILFGKGPEWGLCGSFTLRRKRWRKITPSIFNVIWHQISFERSDHKLIWNSPTHVISFKALESALGSGEKVISKSELACKRKLGKTIVAKRKILKGEVISSQDVAVKVILTADKHKSYRSIKAPTKLQKILNCSGGWASRNRPLLRGSLHWQSGCPGDRGRPEYQLLAAETAWIPLCASNRWDVISFNSSNCDH